LPTAPPLLSVTRITSRRESLLKEVDLYMRQPGYGIGK
jgi:hypothetical protein